MSVEEIFQLLQKNNINELFGWPSDWVQNWPYWAKKKCNAQSLATLPLLHNVWSFMAVFVPSNHIVNLTDNVSVSKHPE